MRDALNDDKSKRAVSALLNKGRLLEAAEIIDDVLPANELARLLRRELQTPRFRPSDLHRLILEIDPKIIVTTNYDDILETLVNEEPLRGGYIVCRHYDGHAVNDLR